MTKAVILGGARTPFGRFGGALKDVSAVELGGISIRSAVDRAGVSNESLDQVIMGMVLQAGAGQIPSRQAARNAGIPWEVATETINKVCASGLRSITLADQVIRAGDAQMIVAGGMESMSNVPYAIPSARYGARMGDSSLVDLLMRDGLWCAFHDVHMIVHGSNIAAKYNVTRVEQDEWALRSHERAHQATVSGIFAEEIVPVTVKSRKKEVVVEVDESIRTDTTVEKLSTLKPAYLEDGSITAGNAPGVNDGAAAVVVCSEDRASELDVDPLATIVGHAAVGLEAADFPISPAYAIQKLLKEQGIGVNDVSLFEINEAFSAVALANSKMLELDLDKVNVNGGAVALGHPVGASGARIVLTLALELKRRGGGLGVAAICSGAAQGDAILIKV